MADVAALPLEETDGVLFGGGVDRYERDVARFEVTGGVVTSPDGRDLCAGERPGSVILERTALP